MEDNPYYLVWRETKYKKVSWTDSRDFDCLRQGDLKFLHVFVYSIKVFFFLCIHPRKHSTVEDSSVYLKVFNFSFQHFDIRVSLTVRNSKLLWWISFQSFSGLYVSWRRSRRKYSSLEFQTYCLRRGRSYGRD